MAKMTNAELRKVIRKFVREGVSERLSEGATPAAILAADSSVELGISWAPAWGRMMISLVKNNPVNDDQETLGVIHVSPVRGKLPCRPRSASGAALPPAWEVRWSYAQKGLGPLLYDIAMEAAGVLGASLTSDREEVSPEAQKIWDYYDTRRPDVTSGILDDEIGTLTPDDFDDDCAQNMSKSIAADKGAPDDWHREPISRAFTTPKGRTPNIDAFRAVGRFDAFGFPEGAFG